MGVEQTNRIAVTVVVGALLVGLGDAAAANGTSIEARARAR